MLKRTIVLVGALFVWGYSQVDHLLISEISLQPNEAEYLKIWNPTNNPIDLTNYYLTDATDTVNQKFYYNLPSGQNYWSGSGSDFIVRFPQGFTIAANSEITIALSSKANFTTYYGNNPDLSVREDFLPAISGATTIGSAPGFLDNIQETLVLFYWDGSSARVQDVDYVLWGSRLYAVNKSQVTGYNPDTPVAQQQFIINVPATGQKLQRIGNEGTETATGGNGITGHDETSENLNETWRIVAITNTKPKITNINYSPASPTEEDQITITATVTDDSSIASVVLRTRFRGNWQSHNMASMGTNIYQVTIGPFNAIDTLYYRIKATDVTNLSDSTSLNAIYIKAKPEIININTIRSNWASWKGQTVTLRGVVTIGSNILRTDRTSAYFQDYTGKGLNLYDATITNLQRGDSVEVTGKLDEYGGVYELTGFASNYQVLAQNVPIAKISKVTIGDLNSNVSQWEGSYVEIAGVVAERADNVGGGSNIVIEDVTGRLTVRIWNTTGALYNSLSQLVNPHLDSLLQTGKKLTIRGVCGIYSNAAQLLLGYADDVELYVEGEPGQEKVALKIAPFPFVPQLGEVLKYTYEYPSNSRVILRVYDQAGRFVTTLIDQYYAVSWHRDAYWNGRNEINELVAPGTYMFYYEVTNRTTGKTTIKVAPAVVGVKLR
jgi:DNA/RNA endonuclease YhcR with UshA esterase domain